MFVLFFLVRLSKHTQGWGWEDAGPENISVGLDLLEQTDLSTYHDILSLKLLCGQLPQD